MENNTKRLEILTEVYYALQNSFGRKKAEILFADVVKMLKPANE